MDNHQIKKYLDQVMKSDDKNFDPNWSAMEVDAINRLKAIGAKLQSDHAKAVQMETTLANLKSDVVKNESIMETLLDMLVKQEASRREKALEAQEATNRERDLLEE